MFEIIILIILLFIFLLKFRVIITIEKNIKVKIYIFKIIKIFSNEQDIQRAEKKGIEMAETEINNYFNHIEFTDVKLFSKNLKGLLKHAKFEKINLLLNINTGDYILNAYLVCILNSLISMFMSKKINQININNLEYSIISNENKTKSYFECIITAKFTNIIIKLIKVLYYMFKLKKKGNDKNGKRASNRKFNGNSNVLTGNNG